MPFHLSLPCRLREIPSSLCLMACAGWSLAFKNPQILVIQDTLQDVRSVTKRMLIVMLCQENEIWYPRSRERISESVLLT